MSNLKRPVGPSKKSTMALTSSRPLYKQRTESLPNTLTSVMFGNGQINPEDNPNYLVYKKVRVRMVLKIKDKNQDKVRVFTSQLYRENKRPLYKGFTLCSFQRV